jgi:HK97 family phage portal protein
MANPLTALARILLPPPDDLQQRSLELAASFSDQINWATRQMGTRPWRSSSINDALGVPAIWGAVSLISDTVGSLSLEAFRQGILLDPLDRPRLIIRPNPFSTPRAFFRDTAFYLASRGEAWWWVAARDGDGAAMSLYPVPPWEITVEKNPRNVLRPIIKWLNREMPNDDMRQITYMPDGLRGKGPLQACGAAISVAVESQEWAANFFSSPIPSMIGETEHDMDETEMANLKSQWDEGATNAIRFVTNGLTLKTLDVNPEQAQLTESRQHSVGDAARIFNMPGPLLEYQMSGSSLTYNNQADIWQDFQRRCLSPHYLEPIEQEMSDLLTRATVSRFNLKQLLRADPKTRAEVHELNIKSGVYDSATAAREEGYEPGNVDYAPTPLALPAATPVTLPIQQRSQVDGFRCAGCNRKLAEAAGPGTIIRCRCGTISESAEVRSVDDFQMRTLQVLAAMAERPTIIHNHPPGVTVEGSTTTYARGAIQVDAPPAAEVSVNPEIHIDAPDMSEVAEAIAAIAERPQPEIRVDAPITVEPAQVTVNIPEQRPITREVKHNKDGKIIQIREVPA